MDGRTPTPQTLGNVEIARRSPLVVALAILSTISFYRSLVKNNPKARVTTTGSRSRRGTTRKPKGHRRSVMEQVMPNLLPSLAGDRFDAEI